MSLSAMGPAQRNAVVSAAVVVIAAFVSYIWTWGGLMLVALLAGAAVLFVLYQPRLAPTTPLPGSTGSLMAALGIAAAAAMILTALYWSGYVASHLTSIDTLVFLVGLIASAVLAWSGWQILTAEGGKFRFGTAAPTPPAETPSAQMPAEPAMPPGETPPSGTG